MEVQAERTIEHPLGYLNSWPSWSTLECAPIGGVCLPLPSAMDYNAPPKERVPAVLDLPSFAIAGSLLPVRTTTSAITKASGTN